MITNKDEKRKKAFLMHYFYFKNNQTMIGKFNVK